MDDLSKVADAIADPVRREILMMLRPTSLTVGDIAARFSISRPAISRHLRVLRENGLV
ncbi:metalloregulator ArsR/SmtB family transcription factor [Streptomyces sp. NPDC051214]|uniref:metalloregulator ArsR/SmtB family transcription factor n=1 Tax=Streptomyces sp. NPDC051214 TaxID=3155282 RepID=UPI0034474D8A